MQSGCCRRLKFASDERARCYAVHMRVTLFQRTTDNSKGLAQQHVVLCCTAIPIVLFFSNECEGYLYMISLQDYELI